MAQVVSCQPVTVGPGMISGQFIWHTVVDRVAPGHIFCSWYLRFTMPFSLHQYSILAFHPSLPLYMISS
jgi:hypothetical protein